MQIGVTGSWRRKHLDTWGLRSDLSTFKAACHQLGAALARSGAAITVGSDADFAADTYVVEGYLSEYSEGQEVHVVRPDKGSLPFPGLYQKHPKAFVYLVSRSSSWRHTRQQFIADVDALVTIGGADGTCQAGLEILLTRKRLVPIGAFGGASSRLLSELPKSRSRDARAIQKLANPWVPALASHVLAVLGANRPSNVMLIHGHAKDRIRLAEWLEKKSLADTTVMAREFTAGKTLPEQFELLAGEADAAIALATPDDLGSIRGRTSEQRRRARQNVWVEVGWFWGRLGRDRVLLLVRGDVEIPSDLDGLKFYRYRRSVLDKESEIRSFLLHVSKSNQ